MSIAATEAAGAAESATAGRVGGVPAGARGRAQRERAEESRRLEGRGASRAPGGGTSPRAARDTSRPARADASRRTSADASRVATGDGSRAAAADGSRRGPGRPPGSRNKVPRTITGYHPGRSTYRNYQAIMLAEFVAAELLVAMTPIATRKNQPGLSPYIPRDMSKLLAIGLVYFLLQLTAVTGQGAARFGAWFGALLLLGVGLNEAANVTKVLDLFSGAESSSSSSGTASQSSSSSLGSSSGGLAGKVDKGLNAFGEDNNG